MDVLRAAMAEGTKLLPMQALLYLEVLYRPNKGNDESDVVKFLLETA